MNADDVQEVDVLLAECNVVAGKPAQALEIVEAISAANPTRLAALERTRGRALPRARRRRRGARRPSR